jgi:hypothetical protein
LPQRRRDAICSDYTWKKGKVKVKTALQTKCSCNCSSCAARMHNEAALVPYKKK